MLGATTKLALYATYLLSTATVQSALARPSFFQTSGWELVDDEPTLRVETTKHEWGSNDVSITKSEYYETKDGEMELELHGSAEGGRDEADVQLEYELLENTVRLSWFSLHTIQRCLHAPESLTLALCAPSPVGRTGFVQRGLGDREDRSREGHHHRRPLWECDGRRQYGHRGTRERHR